MKDVMDLTTRCAGSAKRRQNVGSSSRGTHSFDEPPRRLIKRPFAAIALISVVVAGCSFGANPGCTFADSGDIESLIGEWELSRFNVDSLDECVFTSVDDPDLQIELRLERVPDAQIFVEHAIEAADPGRITMLDIGEGAVLFEDEGVLGRIGSQVVLVNGTVPTEDLVDVLSSSLDLLSG